MQVIVAGAGAVGSYYAALMQLGGMHVSLLARGAHYRTMRSSGLQLVSMNKEKHIEVDVHDHLSCLQQADIILFTCKMNDLAALLDSARPYIRNHTLLISLQNGVDAPSILAEHYPNHAIASGIAFIGVRLDAPGKVVHSAAGKLSFGHWRGKPDSHLLSDFVSMLGNCGVEARLVDDIRPILWRKMLWNCGFNAITALTCQFAAVIAENNDYRELAINAMREVMPVALAEDVSLNERDMERSIADTLNCGPVKTSMWQDIELDRQTEIDHLNGAIVRKAARLGIDAPVNAILTTLIHARQASTD